ncbi:Spx/MgsR family transcriptional regulator [Sphingomonas sp. BE138]|uniref:ArsC family reductase n=1 Tax=Sphingomonas sp. BE138 TaxID=2817845 RepID=UPI00286182D0|nr:ArsC family reductase [Sphingomonas sp. BE138]MDR6787375.1 Spx/MgsR family transcriptional regulator [Sphingomonas sp. BE138]
MTVTLYGIPNCDTVKKARTWLAEHDVAHSFHDYKKAGVDAGALDQWIAQVGWEPLLNRAGTTFRKLPDADKAGIDAAKARALMIAHPSTIKRPVLAHCGRIEVGFKPDRYAALFA